MAETILKTGDSRAGSEDLLVLANKMIHFNYSGHLNPMEKVFRKVSMPDYTFLARLSREMGLREPDTRVYLSDISRQMEIPMAKLSPMVQNLQGKGYVYWQHDGRGTYITLSEIGEDAMQRQQEVLKEFFGNVVNQIGHDEFLKVMDMLYHMEEVMEAEAEKFV